MFCPLFPGILTWVFSDNSIVTYNLSFAGRDFFPFPDLFPLPVRFFSASNPTFVADWFYVPLISFLGTPPPPVFF